MLHLIARGIPAPVHRAAYRLAHRLRKLWWRVRRPDLEGCRVIALDERGHVLLIRHSYGSGKWMPPGGGVGRGEAPLAAALRELREETGCDLQGARQVALLEEDLHGALNRVHVIAGHARGAPRPDGREVIAAAFFAVDDLPAQMPGWLRDQLPGWAAKARG